MIPSPLSFVLLLRSPFSSSLFKNSATRRKQLPPSGRSKEDSKLHEVLEDLCLSSFFCVLLSPLRYFKHSAIRRKQLHPSGGSKEDSKLHEVLEDLCRV
eukprot:scaffold114063_cov50-Attheya_sp.AAC.1